MIWSITAMIFMVACNDSDDPSPSEDPRCLLISSHWIQPNGDLRDYSFTYDQNQITSLESTFTFVGYEPNTGTTSFVYDDEGKIVEMNGPQGKDVFTYSGEVIIKQERFNGVTLRDKFEFEYDNGNLVLIQDYTDNGTTLVNDRFQKLEYTKESGKDPAVIRTFNASGNLEGTAIYTYSNHDAATAALPAALKKYWVLGGLPVYRTASNVEFTNGESITYVYEFNDKGYPLKRTETYTQYQITNIITYGYQCE